MEGDNARAQEEGLTEDQLGSADRCVHYLRSKEKSLHYDRALAAGWPITTGVIEGACRHLIATGSTSPGPGRV
ncbi:hypothetical protein ACH4UT_29305 [Streptomyces sp. NPDC020799]|uniref:hypothetical protein n=1 Tax=Streptomyces sp. NPDC020799 TaxID=3365091 RepID=UPI0037A03603